MSDGCATEVALDQSERAVQRRLSLRTLIGRWWGESVVVAIALLLWLPRLSGPIDLRWDGGVYYLLGTSLAQGHGYRIASEPGSPCSAAVSATFAGCYRGVSTRTWIERSYCGWVLSPDFVCSAFRHLCGGGLRFGEKVLEVDMGDGCYGTMFTTFPNNLSV